MSSKPAEATKFHTRLLRSSLEVENSRAYWRNASLADANDQVTAAFENHWFGAKSMARVKTLVRQFDWQFGSIPQALSVLQSWADVDADTRRLVCHWHLQFSDPLYRAFTGVFVPDRIESDRAEMTKDLVVGWIESTNPEQWQTRTRMRIASNLFLAGREAGLIQSSRDPRTASYCLVTDLALSYLLHLLREVEFDGSLLSNPYLRSVGLFDRHLKSRLKTLDCVEFRKQGGITDFTWRFDTLTAWAESLVVHSNEQVREAS